MGKVRDASKDRYWRGMIRRQRESGETIAQFCARAGVSANRFYWWRRALRARDRQSTANSPTSGDETSQVGLPSESFVPVRFPVVTQASIEMVHPSGWVLRVPAGFDPLSLGHVVATLDRCTGEG